MVAAMKLQLRFRELEPADLVDLDWSGGPEHLRVVTEALGAAYAGSVALRVGELDNGSLVALGGVDFRPRPGAGVLWMLSVHDRLQSLGIGTRLIGELERATRREGRRRAELTVELDNPRASALYRRLGYVEVGPALDHWPVAGGRTYVAACTRLARDLGPSVPGR
jgi:ribosomal protein S18 acetylase RimI-like enzyme